MTYGDDLLSILGLVSRGAMQGAKAGLVVGVGIVAVGIVLDTVMMGFAIQKLRNGADGDCVRKLREIIAKLETSLEEFEIGCCHLLTD